MKIAQLGLFPPFRGGIQHFNTLLYRHLSTSHQVLVINFHRQYPNFLFPGTSQFDETLAVVPAFEERLFDPLNPGSWYRVYRRLSDWQANLVIFKYWMPYFAPGLGSVMRLLGRGNATRSLCIIDNLTPHEHRPGDRLLNRYLVNSTDLFIPMSTVIEQQLLALKPMARYQLNPHPTYTNFGPRLPRDQARQRLGLGPEPVLLYFGYIRKYKGLLTLLDALPAVVERLGAKTIIAGEFYDDPAEYLARMENPVLAPYLVDATRFIPDDEVAQYFSAADVVVLPYLTATQSGIVSIAQEYEVPCIVTSVGGLPEVVVDGHTGLVVPPDDPQALAQAIIEFFTTVDRPQMIKRIAEEKKRFSWSSLVDTIEALAGDMT
ncbi:MAG: glycosyltransferase [Candidatus Marinimicrobia bacterium]|nr:glycosyltransferase [Candidatus Neomarinimicrobiota bacterium]